MIPWPRAAGEQAEKDEIQGIRPENGSCLRNGNSCPQRCQKNLRIFIKNRENPLDSKGIFFYYKEAVRKDLSCPQHCDEPGDCSERR